MTTEGLPPTAGPADAQAGDSRGPTDHGLLHLSPDAVVVVDDDGMVLDANDEATKLFGRAPAVGAAFGIPSSDNAGWSLLDILTPNGPVAMQARTRAVRWSGHPAHVIALRPAPAPAAHAGAVAEVRHDLDNAVTIARGYATTLAVHWEQLADESRQTFLARVVANLDAVADLAADLVDATTGPRPPTRLPVSMRDLVSDAVAAAPTDVVVDVEVDVPAARLLVDRTHARRILRNLIANAVRHGAAPLTLSTTTSTKDVDITVTDSGGGVDPEMFEQIFDRGVSGGGSTGLGLHVARELARANGGDLLCDAREAGRGATFRLRLPLLGAVEDD